MEKKAFVLMYHNIGVPPKSAKLRGLYVTPLMFRFQMWHLKYAGFKVVSLREILSFAKGENSAGKMVALTFDDGYQDFYDNAYPVLKKHGFPATVFLVSDLIGRKNLWDYKELNIKKSLLGLDSIREMSANRIAFGSHTRTHPFLGKLSVKDMEEEISGSKKNLEEMLKVPMDLFCYPYGNYDDKVMEAVKKAGYKGAVTTKRGSVHIGDNLFELRRAHVRLNTWPFSFIYKLHSNYEDKRR